MKNLERDTLRAAVLASIVERSPQAPGRTALMKSAFLLQRVCRVPLGYHFHLYNYGPYDSSLLSDVRQAEAVGLVKSDLVTYPNGGYGYAFSLGPMYHDSKDELASAIEPYADDIEWVIDQFGSESAARLELISTILFAMCDNRRRLDGPELVGRVHEIKPHFSQAVIEETIKEISEIIDCITCHDIEE